MYVGGVKVEDLDGKAVDRPHTLEPVKPSLAGTAMIQCSGSPRTDSGSKPTEGGSSGPSPWSQSSKFPDWDMGPMAWDYQKTQGKDPAVEGTVDLMSRLFAGNGNGEPLRCKTPVCDGDTIEEETCQMLVSMGACTNGFGSSDVSISADEIRNTYCCASCAAADSGSLLSESKAKLNPTKEVPSFFKTLKEQKVEQIRLAKASKQQLLCEDGGDSGGGADLLSSNALLSIIKKHKATRPSNV